MAVLSLRFPSQFWGIKMRFSNFICDRIAIVDDDPEIRRSYGYSVVDLGIEAVPEEGPLPPLDLFVPQLKAKAHAAICDHHFTIKNYATYRGAQLVARCYRERLPAVLCTKWDNAARNQFRHLLPEIPAVLNPAELGPETIRESLELCADEFEGKFRSNRKAWRVLIEVEDVDRSEQAANNTTYVVVPAWNRHEVICIPNSGLPEFIATKAIAGRRFHAQVNLGAESEADLYFQNWEDS